MATATATRRGNETISCLSCGSAFAAWPWEVKAGKSYCSRECSTKSPKRVGQRKVERVSKTCKSCTQTFAVAPYRAETALYCSRDCKDADKIVVTRECLCGAEFTPAASRRNKQQFCSYECSMAHRARSSKEELSLVPYLEPLGYRNTDTAPCFMTNRGRTRVPDFVNREERKVLEYFGSFWHRDCKKADGTPHETVEECVQWYAEIGWDCQVVWDYELDDFKKSLEEMRVS